MKTITFNNGIKMPILGLGTWPMNGIKLVKVVYRSLKLGYTSFDTSSAYGNEKWLGRALRLMRVVGLGKQIFITTKLNNSEQRNGDVRRAVKNSLRKLNVKSIDLYLMHWPNTETYLDCWKQMEELYHEGLIKAIGVCNFHESHLEELLKIAKVIPVINQVELHPLLSQVKLRNYCTGKGIKMEAYTPLARMDVKLVENTYLKEYAKKYGKTVPQIILRWNVQHDIVVIPKSTSAERLKENIDVFDFELSLDEMLRIDSLNENYRVRHNPDTADFSKL